MWTHKPLLTGNAKQKNNKKNPTNYACIQNKMLLNIYNIASRTIN